MGGRGPESWLGSSSGSNFLLLAAGALFVSALASAASATLAALGEHRVESLHEDRRQGRSLRGLGTLVRRPDVVRLALLSLDTLAKLAFGLSLAGFAGTLPAPASWLALGGGALFGLIALITVRAIAVRSPERSLAWVAPFAAGVEMILRPLAGPLSALARWIRGEAPGQHGTTEELEYLIEKGARAGEIDKSHSDLLESVIDFSRVRVREIMVPRPKVIALPADASYEEVVRVVVESGHSRLPVFEESVDNVVGVLYAKRLLADLGKNGSRGRFRLADVVQAAFFVPETMKISHLLAEFQRRSQQMAVVVDEFGGTSGVVTLEDVMEEIVGEIRDEGDLEEEEPIRQVAPGVFLAEGEASIRDVEFFLEEALEGLGDFSFPEEGDYETIGGFVTAEAGRVPRLGETIVHDGLAFTVRGADEKRVARVEITVTPERQHRDSGEPEVEEQEDREVASGRAMARETIEGGTFLSRFVGLRRET